jgi:hypothetical protein
MTVDVSMIMSYWNFLTFKIISDKCLVFDILDDVLTTA